MQRKGGVILYERWIKTPQSEGSLVGVKASAADESSISQRLTVTRMVGLGVFSLATPKRKMLGNAYVVIEGPEVSGVATFSAKNNKNAGPTAFAFAARINNAAREAARVNSERRKLLLTENATPDGAFALPIVARYLTLQYLFKWILLFRLLLLPYVA